MHQHPLVLHVLSPICVYVWSIKCVKKKALPLQFHRISSPSPGQSDKGGIAVHLLTDHSPSSRRNPDVNSVRLLGSPSPLNKYDQSQNEKHYYCWHLYVWSTLFNNQFRSRLPGGVDPLGKPLFAAENLLFSYVHSVAKGRSCFIAVSPIDAHRLPPCLALCLF